MAALPAEPGWVWGPVMWRFSKNCNSPKPPTLNFDLLTNCNLWAQRRATCRKCSAHVSSHKSEQQIPSGQDEWECGCRALKDFQNSLLNWPLHFNASFLLFNTVTLFAFVRDSVVMTGLFPPWVVHWPFPTHGYITVDLCVSTSGGCFQNEEKFKQKLVPLKFY